MKSAIFFVICLYALRSSQASIRSGALLNKLTKIKVVGSPLVRQFMPLTEIPPPKPPAGVYHKMPTTTKSPSGRRQLGNLPPDCDQKPDPQVIVEGGNVAIVGDYYDEGVAKTVATVIIPKHIDHIHFQVTTEVPYLTVGPIEGLGYHPTTVVQGECEKIYQDHMAEQYSDETREESEESMEMAKMPYVVGGTMSPYEEVAEDLYSDRN